MSNMTVNNAKGIWGGDVVGRVVTTEPPVFELPGENDAGGADVVAVSVGQRHGVHVNLQGPPFEPQGIQEWSNARINMTHQWLQLVGKAGDISTGPPVSHAQTATVALNCHSRLFGPFRVEDRSGQTDRDPPTELAGYGLVSSRFVSGCGSSKGTTWWNRNTVPGPGCVVSGGLGGKGTTWWNRNTAFGPGGFGMLLPVEALVAIHAHVATRYSRTFLIFIL